jgi:hypothetical protein
MKVSELRIGNYVKGIGHNISWIIEGIEKDYIYSYNSWRLLSSFQPIPLTKEWLLKIGFEFAVDTWYFNGFALWETEWGDDKGATGIGYFYELRERGMMDKHIQYLHELQNLYYSLTGEEIL